MSDKDSSPAAAVSVVICVRNGEDMIGPCIERTLANSPHQVIVVDGRSTDRTREIVGRFPQVRVLSDEGRGLACARRLGAEASIGTHVLYIGPDNLLPDGFIASFVSLMDEWNFDAASVQTRVESPVTYWDRTIDFRWRCLMARPGPVSVVGTPSLYRRALFDEIGFDDTVGAADDTDISERLRAAGYRLGLVPLSVHEYNRATLSYAWQRFKLYGASDHAYFRKYRSSWTWQRAVFSLTHPLRQTVRYSRAVRNSLDARCIPGLWILMAARYWGWYQTRSRERRP